MNIKNLFDYNWYARRQFLQSMRELPWAVITESAGASFDSIRDVFMHSLQMEQMWIRRLGGMNIEWTYDTQSTKFHTVKLIAEYASNAEAETTRFLDTVTDDSLKEIVEFRGRDGKINHFTIEDVLMHVVEEEIHHRGELICLYWQHDIPPPYTSYMAYQRRPR